MREGIGDRPAPVLVRSSDMAEIHRSATALMNTHEMRVIRRAEGSHAEIRQWGAGGLGLLGFAYRSAVDIRPEPLHDFVAVHLPVRGALVYSRNGRAFRVGAGAGAVISPHDEVRMRWSEDLTLRVLRLDLAMVKRRLRDLTGEEVREPIEFDPVFEPARASALLHVVDAFRLVADLDRAQQGASLLAHELEEAVFSSVLLGLSHSQSHMLGRDRDTATVRAARVAAEFCREHHAEPLPVELLAEVAHVSVRTLFASFRREYGQTPARWIRELRLERARASLLAASDGGGVSAVAAANGFGHVGRFAADYRAAFGETPSATLRRRRAPWPSSPQSAERRSSAALPEDS